MTQRRHAGSRFPSRPRRQTTWNEGPFGVLSASTSASAIFPTAHQAVDDGLTLVRVRGELSLGLTALSGALEGYSRVAAGLCIVSENAAGVGATAIPSPVDDMAWDGWLWFWTGAMWTPGAAGDLDGSEGTRARTIPIDGKAMRKWKTSDVLLAVIQADDEVGTAVLGARLNTRILVKIA